VFEEIVVAVIKAGASKRSANYTEKEDIALPNAWGSISLDAVTDTDKPGKKYFQSILDKFHQLRPKTTDGASCMMRSLQGRYDTIKKYCSRCAACLEQVKNSEKWKLRDQEAPPPRNGLKLYWMMLVTMDEGRKKKRKA
jgi:hypothetical protein